MMNPRRPLLLGSSSEVLHASERIKFRYERKTEGIADDCSRSGSN